MAVDQDSFLNLTGLKGLDFQLSRLDDSIATLYSAVRKSAPKPDEIKAEQIDWLKSKRNACKIPEDLRRTLRERLEVL